MDSLAPDEDCALSRHLSFLDSETLARMKEFYVAPSVICRRRGVEGNGTFSDVFKGTCQLHGQEAQVNVAVKRLRLSALDDTKRLFAAEIYVWSKLDHPNILKLLCFSFEKETLYPLLISSWKEHGNALDYIEHRNLSFLQLLHLLSGIAKGVEYLHHAGPLPVIHSDLKPQNVLIDTDGTPMIGDFGSARIEAATQAVGRRTASFKGTDNYCAFELLYGGFHTMESDMWAYGMTVYALVMKEPPYRKISALGIQLAILQKQLPVISESVDLYTQSNVQHLRGICASCCDIQPTGRMTAKQIVAQLQKLIDVELADSMALVTIRPTAVAEEPTAQHDSVSRFDARVFSRSEIKQYDFDHDIISVDRRTVGRGAFSDVFQGKCKVAGRGIVLTAMKRLRIHFGSNGMKDLLEKEVYVWSKLNHPNILPLLGYAFDRDTGYPIIISEWMENGNAMEYIRTNDCSPNRVIHITADLAQGLSYLHNLLVIHSDIKPENILINRDGTAMICDFGCARIEAASITLGAPTTTMKGTLHYISPEVLQGAIMSMAADVWAFGMTVHALLTRKHPFAGRSDAVAAISIVQGHLPALPPASDPASLCLQNICLMCRKPNPEERPSIEYVLSCIAAEQEPQESAKLRRTLKEQVADDANRLNGGIPVLLERCIDFIEDEGMKSRNLYGENGESAATETILSLFENSDHASLDALLAEGTVDVPDMTDVLRLYLSMLPDPLLTRNLHDDFVAAISHNDIQHSMVNLLRQLPSEHFDSLEYLMQHLCRVLTHARRNRTTSESLASVFGPILMRASQPSSDSDAAQAQVRVVKYLIENAVTIFAQANRERTDTQ